MGETIQRWLWGLAEVVSFGADLATLIVGAIAIWGLLIKRRELTLAYQALVSLYVSQRFGRIKETLGKLESLSFDRKEDRSELIASLGQLCGQLKPLLDEHPSLAAVYRDLLALAERRGKPSESQKRRLLYELHGLLDQVSFAKQAHLIGPERHER